MILDWGKDPRFINWDDGPIYQRFTTSEVLELLENGGFETLTRPASVLEVRDDLGMDLDDITMLRDELSGRVREVRVFQGALTPGMDAETAVSDLDNKTLPEVVVEHLLQIDPRDSSIQPEFLVKLFKGN